MRRIGLYLSSAPSRGGVFQYSMSMLEAIASLPRKRYFPVIAYSHADWRGLVAEYDPAAAYVPISFTSMAVAYGWRKLGLPIGWWRSLSTAFDPPTRKLLSLNCQLWIYPAQNPMAYMVPAPALTTVHDLMHRYEGHFPEVSGFRMRELHYRAACRCVEGVLVDSEIGKQQLVESYGIDASRVHSLPYIPPRYMNKAEDPPDFAKRYRLPEKYLFYPAQFWVHKNHQALLRAVRSLITKLPDIRFVFVGAKKNGYKRVVRSIQELNLTEHIRIFDYVPCEDMPTFYRRARALVMPTFFGPTNIPPLEAMAVGCPMAVSRIYAMPEQCGDAALYFDPTSGDEIADAIDRLWTDDALCGELSIRGRERSLLFSQEVFNRRLLEIVDSMFGSDVLVSGSSRITVGPFPHFEATDEGTRPRS